MLKHTVTTQLALSVVPLTHKHGNFRGCISPFSIYRCRDMDTDVMIVACYHPLPLSACMLHFDLVLILFGTSIPTSFNILVKMFLHL